MTKYVSAEVDVGHGFKLYIDGNSKITAGNGTFEDPVPNAFSLPHVTACPGATPTCTSTCYVHGLRKAAPEVWSKYVENLGALQQILKSVHSMVVARQLGDWIASNCPGGFRWHVSGDILSFAHWLWILRVCDKAADVPFWIYTRSFGAMLFADPETFPENLIVNLSADRDNLAAARQAYGEGIGHRICYMAYVDETPEAIPDLPEGSVIFPDYAHRGRGTAEPTAGAWWQGLTLEQRRMVCPADFFGQSKHHRCGPCRKCL